MKSIQHNLFAIIFSICSMNYLKAVISTERNVIYGLKGSSHLLFFVKFFFNLANLKLNEIESIDNFEFTRMCSYDYNRINRSTNDFYAKVTFDTKLKRTFTFRMKNGFDNFKFDSFKFEIYLTTDIGNSGYIRFYKQVCIIPKYKNNVANHRLIYMVPFNKHIRFYIDEDVECFENLVQRFRSMLNFVKIEYITNIRKLDIDIDTFIAI